MGHPLINKNYYLNCKGSPHIFLAQLNPLSTRLHFYLDWLKLLPNYHPVLYFCQYISVFFSLYQSLRMLRYKHSKSSTYPIFPFLQIKFKWYSFHTTCLIIVFNKLSINLQEYKYSPSILLKRGCICHSDEVKPRSPFCRWVWEGLRLWRCFIPLCNAFGSLSVTNNKMQRGIFRLIFIMDTATDDTFCPIEICTIPWKCQYIIYKNTACEIVPWLTRHQTKSYANFHKIKTVYYN